ncbi:hypothetical protein ACFSCW_03805 [Sphingomonas tabacisoli]|uniref:Uncharacterized protein n=1 Tax=Sphingomonas tabacisoli TaxID=2249466 RepID=A0ABW4I128_9SPHN
MRRADPHRALIRVLTARYPGLLVLASRSEPWASVTFTGARHELTCQGAPDPTGIDEAELALPGHIVADVQVTRSGGRISIEALTIEAV